MAKRKQAPIATSSKERQKPQKHLHSVVEVDKEYKIESIAGEDATPYCISWGDDEETSAIYEDTWETKSFAHELAIDDWERR